MSLSYDKGLWIGYETDLSNADDSFDSFYFPSDNYSIDAINTDGGGELDSLDWIRIDKFQNPNFNEPGVTSESGLNNENIPIEVEMVYPDSFTCEGLIEAISNLDEDYPAPDTSGSISSSNSFSGEVSQVLKRIKYKNPRLFIAHSHFGFSGYLESNVLDIGWNSQNILFPLSFKIRKFYPLFQLDDSGNNGYEYKWVQTISSAPSVSA